jgi:hypothetical protein
MGYPAGADPDRDVVRGYRLRGFPTTVFVAPGGRVAATHGGQLFKSDLGRLLDELEAA